MDLIKSVPPVWDETMVLPDSEIGELAAYAHRKGQNTWFLAVMNGPRPRRLDVPLTFLGEGAYRVMSAGDYPSSDAAVKMENTTRKRADSLEINLRGGGGLLVRFSKSD